jgi:hypothetical protein
LKIGESDLKREQGKLEKQAGQASSKKHAKKAAAKKSSDNGTLSDESMHNMEAMIPWKKQYSKKYASRTIRFSSHGKVMAKESDSDNNWKMPAKMSKKKAQKNLTKNLFLLIQWTLLWMNLIKRKQTVSMPIEKEDTFLGFIELHPPKPAVQLLEQELVLPSDELCTRKKPALYQQIHQGPKVSKLRPRKKIKNPFCQMQRLQE